MTKSYSEGELETACELYHELFLLGEKGGLANKDEVVESVLKTKNLGLDELSIFQDPIEELRVLYYHTFIDRGLYSHLFPAK